MICSVKRNRQRIEEILYVPRRSIRQKKLIAFAFDDGPLRNTERVVAALEKNDARATFFMLGQNALYPETVKKVLSQVMKYQATHGIIHTFQS